MNIPEFRKSVAHQDGEGGLMPGAVALAHQRQAQPLRPTLRHREADQATGEAGHEVDRVRRGELGGDDQVALVLPVLVIDQDEHAAVARVLNDLLDAGEKMAQLFRAPNRHLRLSSPRRLASTVGGIAVKNTHRYFFGGSQSQQYDENYERIFGHK